MLIGVDGARNGWVYCILEEEIVTFELFPHFVVCDCTMWVDIPIGLPPTGERTCDRLARKLLSSRGPTIFPVPVRDAVYAETYVKALEINRKFAGKGFSKQFWNIRNKVIEVDKLLRASETLRYRISESHPELCFFALAGRPLPSKHSAEGLKARVELIEVFWNGAMGIIEEAKNRLKVELHDLLDAFVLALSQMFPSASVPDEPEYDDHGIPMRIVYPRVLKKAPSSQFQENKQKEG